MDSAWSGHLRRLRCTVNEDTRIQNGVQLFCRTATDPQHSPVSLSAESTVAGLAAINTPRLWQCDAGWRSKQPTVHGSLTTSHRCSVTFIGYECHSGSSSNSLCLFSAACMVCLCYTCTRTVPCVADMDSHRRLCSDSMLELHVHQRRRPHFWSLCRSLLERSAIWCHHVAITDRLQTMAEDTALQLLVWSVTVLIPVLIPCDTVVGFIFFCC